MCVCGFWENPNVMLMFRARCAGEKILNVTLLSFVLLLLLFDGGAADAAAVVVVGTIFFCCR